MNYKALKFDDSNAQRVYNNYMRRLQKVIKPIPAADREEVLMEFNSHIYEGIQSNDEASELESLLDAIDKLGAPDEVLKPLVADKLLEKATRSFNPLDVLRALVANITNGVAYIIFFLLYSSLAIFIYLIYARLVYDGVGLFYRDGEFSAFGRQSNTEGLDEVLGPWFIPVMIVCIIVFYILITLLLKLKKIFNKKVSS